MTDRKLLQEISDLLDRADALEREERMNPKPTISYEEFLRRRKFDINGNPINRDKEEK